ncbi:MAG: DMT family transporter [Hyphomicrobium sp.]|nr:DMT family transporter [Hyphomicrobium sp.]MBN9276731.1 DMT family transporter [Hyphomicrobium sp.]
MSTSDVRSSSVQAYALLALAGLCWSGNHVLGRAIAGHVPPVGISALRWVLPCIIAGLLARNHLGRDWPVIKTHWKAILVLGLTGGALFSALQYVGLQYTSAVNVSVLNSLGPVFIVAAVAIMFGETMRPIQYAGIAVSLAGVLFIVTRGEPAMLATMSFNYGDLIILFNMGVWAVYSACLRFRPSIHWTSFMFVFALIAALGTLPFAVQEYQQGIRFVPTLTTLLTIVYVSIFPSLVAYMSWNRGVELIGPNRAGALLHLVALYSAVLAGFFLGERLAAFHVIGFALILAGVTLAARKT